jgi:acetyl-CoA carboxylase biotin carboxyl carrier protein
MNITQIQDLIKFVAKSGVSEVEIEQKDFKITIKTHEPERKGRGQEPLAAMLPPVAAPVMVAAPVAAPAPAPAPAAPKAEAAESKGNLIEIKSPMIGTFYRSSSPDKPAFVEVGKDIKAGDVVCIIEAMKLFNEIESEITGKIVKVLVADSTPVEYDQPLFLVEPA